MFATSSLLLLLAIGQALSQNNGYIKSSFAYVPCVEAPKDCGPKIGHKIPDWSKVKESDWEKLSIERRDTVIDFTALTASLLTLATGNQKCKTLGQNYFCSSIFKYRCYDNTDYIDVNTSRLNAQCNEAKTHCKSGIAPQMPTFGLLPSFGSSFGNKGIPSTPLSFKCSFSGKVRIQRRATCTDFPTLQNDPFTCERNYKVFAGDQSRLKLAVERILNAHMILKNSNMSDAECEMNMADLACKVYIPACSKDRSKIVSLLSKQDCYKIVGCVNKTNDAAFINGAHGMCSGLPDSATAKPYSLDNVYDSKAANNVMAFSTILFIGTFVVQRFF